MALLFMFKSLKAFAMRNRIVEKERKRSFWRLQQRKAKNFSLFCSFYVFPGKRHNLPLRNLKRKLHQVTAEGLKDLGHCFIRLITIHAERELSLFAAPKNFGSQQTINNIHLSTQNVK